MPPIPRRGPSRVCPPMPTSAGCFSSASLSGALSSMPTIWDRPTIMPPFTVTRVGMSTTRRSGVASRNNAEGVSPLFSKSNTPPSWGFQSSKVDTGLFKLYRSPCQSMLPMSVTAREANHKLATSMRAERSRASPNPAGRKALPSVASGATNSAPNPRLNAAKAHCSSALTS